MQTFIENKTLQLNKNGPWLELKKKQNNYQNKNYVFENNYFLFNATVGNDGSFNAALRQRCTNNLFIEIVTCGKIGWNQNYLAKYYDSDLIVD